MLDEIIQSANDSPVVSLASALSSDAEPRNAPTQTGPCNCIASSLLYWCVMRSTRGAEGDVTQVHSPRFLEEKESVPCLLKPGLAEPAILAQDSWDWCWVKRAWEEEEDYYRTSVLDSLINQFQQGRARTLLIFLGHARNFEQSGNYLPRGCARSCTRLILPRDDRLGKAKLEFNSVSMVYSAQCCW